MDFGFGGMLVLLNVPPCECTRGCIEDELSDCLLYEAYHPIEVPLVIKLNQNEPSGLN